MCEIKKTNSKYFSKGGCFEVNWYSDGSNTQHFTGISKILSINATPPQEFLTEFSTVGFLPFEEIEIEMFFYGKIVKHIGFISSETLKDNNIIDAIDTDNPLVLAYEPSSTDVTYCKVREQNYLTSQQYHYEKSMFSNREIYERLRTFTVENDIPVSSDKNITSQSKKEDQEQFKSAGASEEDWDNIGDSTYIDSSTEENKKKPSCVLAITVLVISFLIVGAALAPFSSLDFLLYPIWVGGAILLAKFFENFFGY